MLGELVEERPQPHLVRDTVLDEPHPQLPAQRPGDLLEGAEQRVVSGMLLQVRQETVVAPGPLAHLDLGQAEVFADGGELRAERGPLERVPAPPVPGLSRHALQAGGGRVEQVWDPGQREDDPQAECPRVRLQGAGPPVRFDLGAADGVAAPAELLGDLDDCAALLAAVASQLGGDRVDVGLVVGVQVGLHAAAFLSAVIWKT
ncbi:hypothetical protein GCM10007977_064050 [Dactylosporangium sucinum]|uniref:Uncharacterized protein n=1 Tax=Dactylosporangium sucinum TaxID=1424081 RepID=A0A917U418_9ACTN|nr:hypothetical protein GCM10007977_064050 [Dactylosporangium sucinum]